MSFNVRNRLTFAKISRKDLSIAYKNVKKNRIQNLIVVALLGNVY